MSPTKPAAERLDFVVDRGNLRRFKFVGAVSDLGPGEALLRIDTFAFTANNVTYAVAGDMMSYWSFFPAEPGWGKVPVWGFGDVLDSKCAAVAAGERVFGYFPMSTHVAMRPEKVDAGGFVDAQPHRTQLPSVYNRYTRVANDPDYAKEHEDWQMLFRPLFMTAFLLDDFITDSDGFGARTVVLSSASSKTAIGLAFLLSRNQRLRCHVVGLTSPANAAFVESLGCYNQVVTYEQLAALSPAVPVVFVDMAGNGKVVSALHHHFRDQMKHSCIVGATHWERTEFGDALPGPPPTFFFAPTQLQKRTQEWGPAGLRQRYAVAWRDFLEFTKQWIEIVHGRGRAAVERVYRETLEGRCRPNEGHIMSLWE